MPLCFPPRHGPISPVAPGRMLLGPRQHLQQRGGPTSPNARLFRNVRRGAPPLGRPPWPGSPQRLRTSVYLKRSGGRGRGSPPSDGKQAGLHRGGLAVGPDHAEGRFGPPAPGPLTSFHSVPSTQSARLADRSALSHLSPFPTHSSPGPSAPDLTLLSSLLDS